MALRKRMSVLMAMSVMLAMMLASGVAWADNGNHYGQAKNGNNGNHYGQIKHGCGSGCE